MSRAARTQPVSLPALLVAAFLGWVLMPARVSAQDRYAAGDVVEDFTLVNRATGEPVRLADLAGRIVFLEWFAHWCPFCLAAAPQVEEGIVEWYAARGGNPAGLPVLHVGINLQSDATSRDRTATTAFVERYGFSLVLQDTDRALARRFASSGQPIFAILNGVAGTPGIAQWELLYSRLGYGSTTSPIAEFRAAIDRVPAPAAIPSTLGRPLVGGDGTVQIPFDPPAPEGLAWEWAETLGEWREGGPVPPGSRQVVIPAGPGGSRFIRLRQGP